MAVAEDSFVDIIIQVNTFIQILSTLDNTSNIRPPDNGPADIKSGQDHGPIPPDKWAMAHGAITTQICRKALKTNELPPNSSNNYQKTQHVVNQ